MKNSSRCWVISAIIYNKRWQKANPPRIGEALAADLAAYSSDPLILFIDELDRVAMDADFNQFIRALVGALPDNVQIAFQQPPADLSALVRHGRARRGDCPRH